MSFSANDFECKECRARGRDAFIEDEVTADAICMQCGVVAQRLLSEQTEWRDFEQDDGTSRSRIGEATSIYSTKELSTQVGGHNRGGDRMAVRGGIARSHAQMSGDDQNDNKYTQKIAQIATICELDERTKLLAQAIYARVSDGLKQLVGKKARLKLDALCATVILLACKKAGAPRTFAGLHRMTMINEKDIRKAYKYVVQKVPGLVVDTSGGMTTVESLVRRYAAHLEIPRRLTNLCASVARNARDHTEGRLPTTVAAAALVLVLRDHRLPLAEAEKAALPMPAAVAEVAGVSMTTVNLVVGILRPLEHELFPPGHFGASDNPPVRSNENSRS